jgi:ELWxxDGT repeat protein
MRDTLFFSKLRVFLAGWRLRVRRFRPSQWHRWQRAHRTSYQQRIGTPFSLEPLESRLLLAADLSGVITATTQLDPGVPTTAATATVQVRNQGDAQANATTQVAIYASADATLDSSDVLLGTANTASLNVGQSRNVTVNFGIPNSLTPGSYNLLARVDATNIIAEGPAGEANNISVRTTAFTVAWQFGNVPGRSGNTTLTLRDADGTRVTFRLTGPGLGEVIRDGAAWDVKVTGTSTSSNLTISTNTGGNDRVLINDVHVFGPIGSFTAPRLDLSGTLAIDGTANTLAIGDATGGVIAAQSITSFSVRNLISTNIYIGTTLGQDGKLGGLGTAADTYGQGRLQEFVLTGSMVGSTVRVGVNPVDGNFGNGNDAFFRNGPTGINSVTIGESISSDSRFIARNLPEFYQLAGRRLLTNGDNHFSTDPNTAGGPRLIATLQQDTGVSATDRLTNNPTVVGTVTDPQRIRTFTAGFGATPTFNILGDRQSNGTFTLSTARLEQINGGLLTDGVHTLILHATDTRNNATQIALTFRLDRTAPTTLTLDLDAASDTPPLGDHQTTAGVVTLAGQTEANALVELVGLGRTATASGDGFFSVANVSLALGANAFTVRATDLAGNIRTIPQTITRVSSVANQFPLLNTIGNRAIGEGQPLSFTATASDPDAGQTLTFSLDNGTSGLVPAGASINPTTGVFAWTPSEVQGPGTVAFDVVVTDNGSPNLSDRETITVTVGEVNQQPTLDPITAQTVTAGQLLSFTAVGSDGDVPANTLTYSLQGTVPAGASINPTTGAFTWTPTAGQVGPHSLTLRVTDNGSPTLFAEQTVSITVSSVNQAPIAVNDTFTMTEGGVLSGTPFLVKDINPGTGNSNPTNLVNVNGTLFFTASTPGLGVELWRSDGTAAGTVLVKDVVAGTGSSNPAQLTNVNGTLFFTVDDGVNGRELWKSDGTAAGTVLVKDINPGSGSGFSFLLTDTLLNLNGTLFFTANDGVNGVELWKSDGTAAGTVMVRDIRAGANSSSPAELTEMNGTLFFTASDGISGTELWKSDGTAAGTLLVKDISSGGSTGFIQAGGLTNVNGTLFFAAGNPEVELWKSDGTAAGTVLVANLNGALNSFPRELTNVNGTLFFTAATLTNGTELLKSDGTAAGTVVVKDIVAGTGGSSPDSLTYVGGKLFFRVFDSVIGQTLWVSDGTAAGTLQLAPGGLALPGAANGSPLITDVNGTAFFRAGGTGNDLWKSDGTLAGTVPVGAGLAPQGLTSVNGTLFFTGTPGGVGRELMKVNGEGNVLANDSDPNGDPLTAILVSGPTNGTLTLNPNGMFNYTPNSGFTGTDTFTYKANDGSLDSSVATVTITVTAAPVVNQAPTLNAIGTQTVDEGQPLSFTATASDPNAGQTLTFSLANGTSGLVPAGASINPTTGAFTWTPTEAQGPGPFTFDVVVTDNGSPSLSDRETITVTVGEVNQAPTLDPIAAQTVTAGQVLSFTAVGSDNDVPANSLTYSLQGTVPVGASLDPNTGAFTWTPTADQVGSHSLTLRVTDNGSPTLFAEQVVSITVEAIPNQAPTLNAIGNQTISEHLPFTFTATATDADAGQTLTFSLANGTSGLVPAGASINPTTGLFSWTPTESQGPGTFTFDVVVTDNGSPTLSDRETLTVTVNEANAAPVLLRSSVPIGQVDSPLTPVGAVGTLVSAIADLLPPAGGADSVSDSDAGAVTGIAVSTQAGLPLWYSLDNGATWTPFSSNLGNVRLLAADANTRLFVSPPSIDFTGSRANEFLFQAWDQTVGTNGGVITTGTLTGPTGAFSATFAQATVIFIEDQVTNQAPVLAAIGNQSIDEDQPLTFTATATDANAGQTLTFSLDNGTSGQVPAGATINATTGVFTWTPTEAQGPGTFTFDVVVTDNGSPALSDRETITVTVGEVNQAPTLAPISDQTVTAGQLLSFTAVGSDLDLPANALIYSLQGTVPVGASIDPDTGAFTWTPTAGQVGPHSLTLRVTDNGSPNLFAEQVVSITVEAIPNQAPTLNAIGNQTISEHLPFTFTATASDADAGQTLTFSLANGTSGAIPAGATINPTTGVFTWTPIEAQGPGTFTFDVVVTDNGSAVLTDRETLTVTVTEANAAPVLLRGSVPIGQVDSPLTPVGPDGRLISEIADLVPPTGGADSVSDSDAGAVTGIAISLSAGLPLWYSLDNGTTWVGFSPSASNVRLLAADASTRLFVSPPSIDFAGSRLNEFTFQAWDRTVGSNGGVITTGTLTGTGPTGAFSSSFAQATVIFIEDQVTNQAPVLAAIGNQTIDEGQPLSFTATASDPNAGQTLAFSLANGTSGLVPLGASINPTTGAFSWTPTEAQGPGTFTFDVVVTDNGSPALSDRETITITVTEANAAPVLNVVATPTLVVDENAPGPVGAVGTLISTLVDMNPPAGGLDNVTDLDAAAVTGVAIVGRNSSFNWFYSLNGGSSWTAFGSAGQGPSSALLLAADSLTRIYAQPNVPNMTGSDFFGFDFRAWDQTSGTNGGTVNTAGAIGGAGTFSVNVDSVRVTINSANDAPVLSSIGSQSIEEGQLLTFTATANDPDAGQTLTFSLENGASGSVPAGASINPTIGAFSWTPTDAQGPGSFTFDVVVTDNGSPALSDRETITVTVGEVNQQPTLDPIAAQTVTAGQLLTFTAVGSDGDVPANSLTYSLQGTVPVGATINSTTGAFSWTPTAGQVGPHSLTVRVTDNGTPSGFRGTGCEHHSGGGQPGADGRGRQLHRHRRRLPVGRTSAREGYQSWESGRLPHLWQYVGQRQRHGLLCRTGERAGHGTLEERRDGGGYRLGHGGGQARCRRVLRWWRAPAARALLSSPTSMAPCSSRWMMASMAGSCGRATGRRRAPSWSRISIPAVGTAFPSCLRIRSST